MGISGGGGGAVLIVRDEVNCKFDGIGADVRRRVMRHMTKEVPHARFTDAYEMGRWDGKVRFFDQGGNTYVNLLDEVFPILEREGVEFSLDDRRADFDFRIPDISADHFSHVKWPAKHPCAGEPVVLRDYQREAVNGFLGQTGGLQEIATGAGKTLITAALSSVVERAYPDSGRTIVVVPSKSLVTQTLKDYLNVGLDAGVYYGDRKETGRRHTICTWQSLGALWDWGRNGGRERMEKFAEGAVAVIVDECHQAKASVLKGILGGPFSRIPIRWGLTGTVPMEEHEQWTIRAVIGERIGALAAKGLQDDGVLANCHIDVFQLQDRITAKSYHDESRLILGNPKRMEFVADLVDALSEDGNTLVLVDRIAAAQAIAERLPPERATLVTGKMDSAKRAEHYDSVADSDDRIIVATYGVASVGINMVRLHNLVLIEAGRSPVRVMQSIGRALRRGEGKDHARILDLCSSARFSKRQLTERKKYYRHAQYPFTVTKVNWEDPAAGAKR